MQAAGVNSAGTLASSTATVSLNLPRGGGLIYAQAVTGIAGMQGASLGGNKDIPSLAQTGWSASGERFANMEITSTLGGVQRFFYSSSPAG